MTKEALSRDRIVEAAIALLDEKGEDGLTFRALATKLETGAGAIYWHIKDKSDLLDAASEAIVASALGDLADGARASTPRKAIRKIAAGVFVAVDAHPWVGAQLSRAPWPAATIQIFERIGRHVQALGAPVARQFTAASTLLNYIIGVSVQNAAQAAMVAPGTDRATFLATVAAGLNALDADAYSFTRSITHRVHDHDDRAEFLAGIDLILGGMLA